MDKRKTRWTIKRLEQVKTWQLVVVFVLVSFIAATFLRLNNVGMLERREAVFNADKNGDIAVLEKRLFDLQNYVSSHMNADPGRIALDHSYKKLYNEKLKGFENLAKANSGNNVVAKVREVCDARARAGGYGWFTSQADPRYVNCINEEWSKYPAAQEVSLKFEAPATEPYYHTFVSPLWTADFAGWSVLIAMAILLIIVIRLVALIALKIILRQRNRLF